MKAILTFHSIDDSGSVLSYPAKSFASLLEALSKSGMPVVTLDELLRAETRQGISLTFDDGMRSLFSTALPILQDYAFPAHLYLTTGSVAKTNRWPTQPDAAPGFDMLSWDEIEKCHAGGVQIEAHTHTHPDMRELDNAQMQQECDTADALIETRLGRRPRYFAYPYGYKNDSVSDFVRSRYAATVTTQLSCLGRNDDTANLPRLDSYYLRAPWIQQNLASPLSRAYLSLRSVMRTVRGTQ
jgi:peptidoglycan/xylan/chitin deacetylase (PgdA/CDA1 family)